MAECAACAAVHLGSLDATTPERTTTTVTSRKREQVLARDGHCCTVPGCRRNVGLDLHHIEYQSRGGGHELRNLTTICDLHHRAVHFGKLVIRGTAPGRVTFELRKPRDRHNVTDDDVPAPPSPGSARSAVQAAQARFASSPPPDIRAIDLPEDPRPPHSDVDRPAIDGVSEPESRPRSAPPVGPTWTEAGVP